MHESRNYDVRYKPSTCNVVVNYFWLGN